jgi:hypothetical protein
MIANHKATSRYGKRNNIDPPKSRRWELMIQQVLISQSDQALLFWGGNRLESVMIPACTYLNEHDLITIAGN